jgi:hypothetical protein
LTYFRFSSSFICSARSSVVGRMSRFGAVAAVEPAAPDDDGFGVPPAEPCADERLLSGERTSVGRMTRGEADMADGGRLVCDRPARRRYVCLSTNRGVPIRDSRLEYGVREGAEICCSLAGGGDVCRLARKVR